MRLTLRHDLACVTAILMYCGVSVELANVLVDTGAASTRAQPIRCADFVVSVTRARVRETSRSLRDRRSRTRQLRARDRRNGLRISVRRDPRRGLLASRWRNHRPRPSHDRVQLELLAASPMLGVASLGGKSRHATSSAGAAIARARCGARRVGGRFGQARAGPGVRLLAPGKRPPSHATGADASKRIDD